MERDNNYDERIQYRKRKTICLVLFFFVVLTLALLVSIVYLVTKENSENKFDVLNSKTKRSICPTGNCDKGLNQIQNKIICPPVSEQKSICLSKSCTLTAATLLSAMDTSVDPCDDFYAFSCSNFIRKNLVPDEKNRMTTFLQYEDQYILQQKNLIETYNSYGEPDVVYRLQETYHVCINRSYDREKELAAFKDYVINVLDGWPLTIGEHWKPKRERLDDYLADLFLGNVEDSILSIEIREDYNETSNTTKKYPVIQLARFHPAILNTFKIFNLTAEVSDDQENMMASQIEQLKMDKALKKILLAALKLFGNTTADFVQAEMEETFKFLQELIKIHPSSWVSEDTQWMTIQELNDFTNGTIDWLKLIEAKLHGEKIFDISDEVRVDSSQSLKQFPELMNKFSRRPLTNYISQRNILDLIIRIGIPDLDELVTEFYTLLGMKTEKKARWMVCLDWITETYPLVLTRMYVKTFLDTHSKETVDYMIRLIQEAYKKQINESDWLDEKTKERALRKADAIKRHVGYPDFILNDTAIEEEYSHIPTVKSSYFSNVLELHPLVLQKKIESRKEKDRWFISPLEINAMYMTAGNSIWFPSGILQLPFFGENRLAAINFGMIGNAIGHEIGHAFDNSGSNFNENGEWEKWWANGTDDLFEERTQCFIDQYNNYCPEDLQGGEDDPKTCQKRKNLPTILFRFYNNPFSILNNMAGCSEPSLRNIKVNGLFTAGENMADNTGHMAAYNAYKRWIEENGEEKRLPGLEEYSPEQLYFISFAYIWCENVPTDKWLQQYKWNPHAAGRYRILGTLSNNEEFRRAFNCPVGNMNRGNQSCVLW